MVNKKFCLGTALSVPNVKPDDGHIGLRGDFDDSGFGGVMPYKHLGKVSDNLHPNNQNNQLERKAWPPQRCSLDA